MYEFKLNFLKTRPPVNRMKGVMGFRPILPAHEKYGHKKVWKRREYGLRGVWVKRESTVYYNTY